MAWVFWGSLALVAHAYGGYLLCLVAWDAWTRLKVDARTLTGRCRGRAESSWCWRTPIPGSSRAHSGRSRAASRTPRLGWCAVTSDFTARETRRWTRTSTGLESLLKLYEGRCGTVVGANGGIYAVQRALFTALPPGTVVDDFVIPMRVLERGYRVEFEPLAVARGETAGSADREFKRRARIAAGNFKALGALKGALSPWSGRCAFASWSHKVLRWATPALLATCFAASAVLARSAPVYGAAFLARVSFYGLAVLGSTAPGRSTKWARWSAASRR